MKTKILSKRILSLCIFLVQVSLSFCQQSEIPRSSVYVELGGDAFLGSINYEYRFSNGTAINLDGRMGLLPLIPSSPNIFLVTGLNTIWGSPPHLGEVGISHILATSTEIASYPSVRLGYRYEGLHGFLFKAAFTLIKSNEFFDTDAKIHRWFGISFGRRF